MKSADNVEQTGESARDLSIAVIGFGLRSSLVKYLNRPGQGAQVTMVCDLSERGRADAEKRLPGVTITDDLNQVLAAEVDAAVVLVPDYAHAPVAIALLNAGIPTFCEKPLAITLEDADLILQAAYEHKTKLYVGHNMRHMPVIKEMRDLIAEGRIGEVKAIWCRHFVGTGGDFYFKDWHAERSKSNTLLLQKGAHDIDVIHWLASGYTRSVSAMGELSLYGQVTSRRDNSDRRMWDWYSEDNWPPLAQRDLNPIIDVEDLSMVNMRLDNGVLASYEQCMYTPDYWRNYTVIGTEGRLENFGDGPGAQIKVWGKRGQEPTEVITIADTDGGHGGADPALIDEFVRFLREGGVTETSPIAAREAVATASLAARSIRTDGSVQQVPPVPGPWLEYFTQGQVG